MPPPSGFFRAFVVSVLGTGSSRVLGAARDMVIAATLGAGAQSDAFLIAFTIPNLFRRFVADEGLTGALIPAIAQSETNDGTAAAHLLANRVFGVLMVVNLGLCVLGYFGADVLVWAFASRSAQDPATHQLASSMTAWMMPFVGMVSAVSLMEGLLNHRGHFFWPKIAPGLVSAGVIVSALLFAHRLDEPAWAIVAGVLAGGVLHVLVNVPTLLRLWGAVWPRLDLHHASPRFFGILNELSKVIGIGIFAQINILVLRQLADAVGTGSITRYWYANRLVDLAQGIIAVAIGSAMLPGLAQSVAAQDWTRLREELARALRLAAFLLFPVAMALITFGEALTAVLFLRGRYTWLDVQLTAACLAMMVPFMLSVAAINLLKKLFFAFEDRNPLLVIGAVGVALTAGLGWLLVGDYGISGLAAALSAATTSQLVLYVVVLSKRHQTDLGLSALFNPFARMALATVPMGLALRWMATLADWDLGAGNPRNLAVVAGGCAVGGLIYAVAAWLLGVEELQKVVNKLYGRLKAR